MKTITLKKYIKKVNYLLGIEKQISGIHITWVEEDGSIWEQKTKLSVKNTARGRVQYSTNDIKIVGWRR